MAINIEDFLALDEFKDEVERVVAWVKGSRRLPGVDEILIPGEIEFRTRERRMREGIPVDDSIVNEMNSIAHDLGVDELN